MENNTQPTTQPISDAKPKGKKLAWILVIVLALSTAAGFGLYFQTKQQKEDLQKELLSTKSDLDKANEELKKAVFLPEGDKYEPLCSSNNADTRLAQVNTSPINGYNLYMASCSDEVLDQNFSSIQIIGFKVSGDGEQTFAFGVGQGEPFCVPDARILPVADAAAISAATGLPLCGA